jgi:phosphoribosyl 1,2-cyclic phosphodiesterase
MRARVWGCRGSLPAPGADTVRYGGNTSCLDVRLDSGHTLVLDAGTGMRALGVTMEAELSHELHILLTHLHLDHLQGLGFFRPLFRPDVDVHRCRASRIASPPTSRRHSFPCGWRTSPPD